MLPDGKDKGVVEGEIGALGLRNIQIVPLRMRRRVESQERVWRIASSVHQRQANSQGMRIHLV